MYAIIKANGKQYKVEPGQKIELDRMLGEPGDMVSFDEVILYSNEGESSVGTPLLSGCSVKAELLEHFRAPKIVVFKMKRRKRNRVKRGHRQEKTRLRISEIVLA
ncbi:MAG: 50S ribosomal protein L21 [Lentisphaeria bacterium]|jgi:large subunit ribosomal protein L21|nr:50S ribosomal protein L21 [Lentisphaeria bacterium]MDY0175452.1 50S ribosomal protein L21 [Lentisphaeria bacterium]NLZ60344.1 50S ribosomal protein L21 [Lentisphaerota bacterium]